jgi:hypothetical protein
MAAGPEPVPQAPALLFVPELADVSKLKVIPSHVAVKLLKTGVDES